MLKELWGNLWALYTPNTPSPWYSNPLVAWIFPLFGAILGIEAKITTNQVLVQYQTVPNIGGNYSYDTCPL